MYNACIMATRRCPKCPKRLLTSVYLDDLEVEVDRCAFCKGTWFDKNELLDVVDTAVKNLSVQPDAMQSGCQCPVCHEYMVAFIYPQTDVTVDMCRKCKGLWLDSGELKQIRAERHRLEMAGQLDDHSNVGVRNLINVALGALNK